MVLQFPNLDLLEALLLESRCCLFGQDILVFPSAVHFCDRFPLEVSQRSFSGQGVLCGVVCIAQCVCACSACNSLVHVRKGSRMEIVGDGCRVRHLQGEVRESVHFVAFHMPGLVLMPSHHAQFHTACVICLSRFNSTSNWR